MDNLDTLIFKNKKFSSILEEIYTNQKSKEKQISTLINELKPLITDIGDATLIVPLIKEYMDLGLKNDDHLIKMATLIQRFLSQKSDNGSNDFSMSEEEKEQLLKTMEGLK